MIASLLAATIALAAHGAQNGSSPSARPVIVASKPFGESYLLAEMFAQLLESRGLRVDRRPGLGATDLAFSALQSGAIDVYPEYTGTGLLAILHETPSGGTGDAYRRVSTEFRRRWGAHNVRTHGTGVKHFRHHIVGELTLAYESMDLRAEPDLTMTVYAAEPASPTEDALRLLASWAAASPDAVGTPTAHRQH